MARTRGWAGNPPADDDEARSRIIAAAKRCLDQLGPIKTGLADIAADLGVTRQTVYRYFTTTDDLVFAAAAESSEDFMDRLAAHVDGLGTPETILAEAMVWTLERLPEEPYMAILLQPSRRHRATQRMIEDTQSVAAGRSFLDRLAIDWDDLGFSDRDLDEFAELLIRMFTSFLSEPGGRSRDEQRRFFERWVGGTLRAGRAASR